jgi:uncharacterized membrane protein
MITIDKIFYFCAAVTCLMSGVFIAGMVFVFRKTWFQKQAQTVIHFVPSRIDGIVDWTLGKVLGKEI